MDNQYSHYTILELDYMHHQAKQLLEKSLLEGKNWAEVRELRIKVTLIARAIHKRKFPITSPAETLFRP